MFCPIRVLCPIRVWASPVRVYLYAKQKHPGCKKRRGQSEAAVIKYIAILATKNFDIKLRPRISQLAI